jgi:hypothetical protein
MVSPFKINKALNQLGIHKVLIISLNKCFEKKNEEQNAKELQRLTVQQASKH